MQFDKKNGVKYENNHQPSLHTINSYREGLWKVLFIFHEQ